MDFARKQLEKYGWTDGKGLGKHENGISQALKPKIKRSVTGVGHDAAAEFNEHWWTTLYDKAAGNVEVEEKNGKTKKIKTKDDGEFVITNSTWKMKKKSNNSDEEEQYSEYFVRTAVLTGGGGKTEKVRDSESEEDENEKRDVFRMTDEELFKACEGRTAHKGARHGLKATGKLARIAQQEAMLLAEPKYNGYSHAKNLKDKLQAVEEMNLNRDSEVIEHKKRKKKRKRCNSNNKQLLDCAVAESIIEPVPENNKLTDNDGVASVIEEKEHSKKSKKKNGVENMNVDSEINDVGKTNVKTKKKKKRKADREVIKASDDESNVTEGYSAKKSKKYKSKNIQ